MRAFICRMMSTCAGKEVVILRIALSGIFISEGIAKILYPVTRGIGYYIAIGIPAPGLVGPILECIEIIFGFFLLCGFLTRAVLLPLIMDVVFSILITKTHLLALQGGVWLMFHEIRGDYATLLAAVYLMIIGAGKWSVDYRLLNQTGYFETAAGR